MSWFWRLFGVDPDATDPPDQPDEEKALMIPCPCGRSHPIDSPFSAAIEAMVRLEEEQGQSVLVEIPGSDVAYEVPRRYIALHGIAGWNVAGQAARYGWAARSRAGDV